MVKVFWWSPRRDWKLAGREMRSNGSTWIRLARATGRPLQNFGDEMTPAVLGVLGIPAKWAAPDQAELIAVGSIIEYVAKRSDAKPMVWGSGLREPTSEHTRDAVREQMGTFLAVRGPRSLNWLGLPSDLPFGDPGVFAPELLKRAPKRRTGTLIIPHFRTWSTREGLALLESFRSAGFRVMPPAVAVEEAITTIASSDFVVSSSLHGVIVANALGVPAQAVLPPRSKRAEPTHKYEDYFASVGDSPALAAVEDVFNPQAFKEMRLARFEETDSRQITCANLAERLARAATVLR